MDIPLFFSAYLLWHYSSGLSDYFRVWSNFFWFGWHFFSIPLLFRTLFSPWKRLAEKKKHVGLDPEEFFSNLVVNVIMRVVGFCLRLFVIVIGLGTLSVISLAGLVGLIVWVVAPALVPVLFVFGFHFLFS